MKTQLKCYPLHRLLKDFEVEYGQDAKTTMEHLQICKDKRLLYFDDEFVYGLCGSI